VRLIRPESTIIKLLLTIALSAQSGLAQSPGGRSKTAIEAESLRHFQAILRFDTSNPPGNEKLVVDYLREVLEREGIATKTFARDPQRPNLVARLRGNGRRRPILIMGHTDVVPVDGTKWKFPPFAATLDGGYIYGRGTVDDKLSVAAGLMTILELKRQGVELERDVIFLAEASEEGGGPNGITFMVEKHWPEIEAEFCLAEGGGVIRTGNAVRFATVATTEKIAHTIRLVARGVAGHGSVPLRSNAIVHLSQAIARIAAFRTDLRLNETTRIYFERMAELSTPEEARRFRSILQESNSDAAQEHLAINQPRLYSTLRTSISPNIVKGGYLRNVIPSEAEATLDIRAVPDEDMPALLERLRQVVDDPAISFEKILPNATRPAATPSRLDAVAFRVIEDNYRRFYGATTLPTMMTGGTDMAYLRARGVQCYGIGPLLDSEDGPLGYGAHSDQERILEQSFHTFVQFQHAVVLELAGKPSDNRRDSSSR
jgi:acetylornithine deacetylase/succinyl-diaminopimelate desuccinylase-like protein